MRTLSIAHRDQICATESAGKPQRQLFSPTNITQSQKDILHTTPHFAAYKDDKRIYWVRQPQLQNLGLLEASHVGVPTQ